MTRSRMTLLRLPRSRWGIAPRVCSQSRRRPIVVARCTCCRVDENLARESSRSDAIRDVNVMRSRSRTAWSV
eukprot:2165760-Pleurochrysis_carterae.AAC.4